MIINRIWAMPNLNTFQVKPIGDLVKKYLKDSEISIDPFARNNDWATFTNDLNPETSAQSHKYAKDFLEELVDKNIKCDMIIFDPPYSLRQAKECYEHYGKWTFEDTKKVGKWVEEKNLCATLLVSGGYFLHFGWHTNGLGKKRNTEIVELLVVAHGGAHNDTLCLVERKLGI